MRPLRFAVAVTALAACRDPAPPIAPPPPTFAVIDPERHDEDFEAASIPHLEVTGTSFMVGNEFEVVEMDGLRIRGPAAMRVPRL